MYPIKAKLKKYRKVVVDPESYRDDQVKYELHSQAMFDGEIELLEPFFDDGFILDTIVTNDLNNDGKNVSGVYLLCVDINGMVCLPSYDNVTVEMSDIKELHLKQFN